jgi:hypothetical protein
VEFVAQDPALLIKQSQNKEDEILGHLERVEIDEAKIERGFYDEQNKPKEKKKRKKRNTVAAPDKQIEEVGEDGFDNIEGNYLEEQEKIPAVQKRKTEIVSESNDPSTKLVENEAEGEGEKGKHKKHKKKKKKREEDEYFEEDKGPGRMPDELDGQPDEPQDGEQDERPGREKSKKEKKSKKDKKEMKNKRKEEILRIKNEFMEKLISPFTDVDELVQMFMRPLPKEVGILE